jgi:predicted Zn-dependent protease
MTTRLHPHSVCCFILVDNSDQTLPRVGCPKEFTPVRCNVDRTAHLRTVLGQVHAAHGRLTEARTELDLALASTPDLVSALVARATVAYETNDTETTLADLDRAVDLAPDDPTVRFNRAHALENTDRTEDALIDLTIAAGIAPDDEDIAEALHRLRPTGAPVG